MRRERTGEKQKKNAVRPQETLDHGGPEVAPKIECAGPWGARGPQGNAKDGDNAQARMWTTGEHSAATRERSKRGEAKPWTARVVSSKTQETRRWKTHTEGEEF